MGLKVFLSGLKDPLGPIIRAQAPCSLKEALRLCLEEGNYHYAKTITKPQPPPIPFKPQHFIPIQNPKPYSQYPPIQNRNPFPQYPLKQNINPFQQYPPRQQQFRPFPYRPTPNPFNVPRPQNTFQSPHNPFANKNAFAPKFNPQPKPTPMDVDPSMRSRKINYMNRPNYQIGEEYPDVPDEQIYYPCEFYPPHDEHTEHSNNDSAAEEQQPDQVYVDAAEVTSDSRESSAVRSETDDLNFQMVAYSPPQT